MKESTYPKGKGRNNKERTNCPMDDDIQDSNAHKGTKEGRNKDPSRV
jgi:hypothetical protein